MDYEISDIDKQFHTQFLKNHNRMVRRYARDRKLTVRLVLLIEQIANYMCGFELASMLCPGRTGASWDWQSCFVDFCIHSSLRQINMKVSAYEAEKYEAAIIKYNHTYCSRVAREFLKESKIQEWWKK